VDSQETSCYNGAASNAFDGSSSTMWHTQYCGSTPAMPHEIQINLGGSYILSGFQYLARQDGCAHGWISQYEFYVSADGVNWGTPVASGNFSYGGLSTACPGGGVPAPMQVSFSPVTGQFIRLRALSEINGNPWTSAADIDAIGMPAQNAALSQVSLSPANVIAGTSSNLTLTLTGPAPNAGAQVTLSSTNPPVATVPATVTVPGNAISATFTVTTAAVTSSASPAISATYNGVTKTATLGVYSGAAIPQTGWSVAYVDSQETYCYGGAATNAFDGNSSTMWHTQYCGGNPPTPHEIQINLGASYTLVGFEYLARQDHCANGWIKQYEFYVSADGVNWGTPVATGAFDYGSLSRACPGGGVPPVLQVAFPPATGQYIRLRALSEINGNRWTSMAEINVLQQTSPPQYQVSPASLSLLVGQSRTVSVTDSSGNPVTGLSWITTDPSIVSLSTDDPPLLTGVAPGSATVYAADAPIAVTVYAGSSLPPGTPVWSVPLGGPGAPSIVPAVPSASGADIFTADTAGNLSAISNDGTILWGVPGVIWRGTDATGQTVPVSRLIPDFSGNVLLKSPFQSTHAVQKVDPTTGQLTNLYTFSLPCATCTVDAPSNIFTSPYAPELLAQLPGQVAIPHPSGVLFILDIPAALSSTMCNNVNPCTAAVTVLDPSTGTTLAHIDLENSTVAQQSGIYSTINHPPGFGKMIVAGDGNAYLPYAYYNQSTTGFASYQNILRVSPDGTYAKIQLNRTDGRTTGPYPYDDSAPCVMTNGATGIAAFAGFVNYQTNSIQSQLSYVSQDSVTSQVNAQGTGLMCPAQRSDGSYIIGSGVIPVLQREDGSYIATDGSNTLIALAPDGSQLWSSQIGNAPITPLYATSDGGVIVTSTPSGPIVTVGPNGTLLATNQLLSTRLGTLYTVDQNGNVTSETPDTGAAISWTGQWYGSSATEISGFQPQTSFATDDASFWSQAGGNPSQNAVAIPQCPCLLQSTEDTSSATTQTQPLETRAVASANAQLSPPADCLICTLTAPNPPLQPLSCMTIAGSGPTNLLLIGDPGLNNPGGNSYNVGYGFSLAAQQKANDLHAQGNKVIACRVSSVQDFNAALTQNGFINGDVHYFGHSGITGFTVVTGAHVVASTLYVGQAPGANTNIGGYNVDQLCNTKSGCNIDGILSNNTAIRLNGCDAGKTVPDYWANGNLTSIAQLIANQLRRGVYAYDVGTYFSSMNAANDPNFGPGKGWKGPSDLPVYMIPLGAPHNKPNPVPFIPH